MIKYLKTVQCLPTEEMRKKNSNYIGLRKVSKLSAIFFLTLVVLAGCKKPELSIGLGLQSVGDQLGLTQHDTSTVIMYTVVEDSLRMDEIAGNNVIGSYLDPVFGNVHASIYSQARLEANAIDFIPSGGTLGDVVLDSMNMYLSLDGFYGNLDAQTFTIYQINEDMFTDSAYYSNKTLDSLATDLVAIGQGTIVPDPYNTAVLEGDIVDPILRIPMDLTFGNTIVAESGNTPLVDNDGVGGFIEWSKGFLISINNPSQANEEGAILYVDMLHANSKITMYYRHTLVGSEDTLSFNLNFNSSCARYSRVLHGYGVTSIGSQVLDSTEGQLECYIQALAGTKVKIDLPHLNSLLDSGMIAINKAELVLPFNYFSGNALDPQSELFVFATDSLGEPIVLSDQLEGSDHYGGKRDDDNKEYRFNVSKHLNDVLSGRLSNNPLILMSSSSGVTANRVVLNGPNSTNRDAARLIITYTNY